MSKHVEWIEYKGNRILLCNFSNFNEQQYLDGVDEMEKELLNQPQGSRLLHIVDVTDSTMTQKTSDRGKKTVELLSKAGIATLTAMVGITGIKKIIAKAISKDVYFAKDMDSAKDWLIENKK
jgi:hypothetical protein